MVNQWRNVQVELLLRTRPWNMALVELFSFEPLAVGKGTLLLLQYIKEWMSRNDSKFTYYMMAV
jgi:hypothetical protein